MQNEPSVNQSVLAFQKALPGFGIVYTGNLDGVIDSTFAKAMKNLEELIQAKTGELMIGKIFSGNINMSVGDVYRNYFPELKKIPFEPIRSDLMKSEIQINKNNDTNDAFKLLLSENLPIVGKLYNGDLSTAAKTLETVIGKEIGKPMNGIIWNDQKQTFNTTPDDIRKALSLISSHRKDLPKISGIMPLDERFLKMSKILLEIK